MDIHIKQVNVDDADYQQVYDLREEVLRKPIGLSLKDENLSNDRLDIILAAFDGQKVIGCVMLQPTEKADVRKLRQMAVALECQGKKIGQQLVLAAEALLKKQDVNKIILHARQTAIGFYEKLGYKITSGIFTEVNIPHVFMEKMI